MHFGCSFFLTANATTKSAVIAINVVVSVVVVDFYVFPSPCLPQPLSFLFLPSLSTPLPDVRRPCQLLSIKITARVYRTPPLQCKSVWHQKAPSPSYCFKLPNRTGVIKKKVEKGVEKGVEDENDYREGG